MADESTKKDEKRGLTTPQKVGIGIAAGAALVGLFLWRARAAAAAAIAGAIDSAKAGYDPERAIVVLLGMPATVPVGASVLLMTGRPDALLESASTKNAAVLQDDGGGAFYARQVGDAVVEGTYTPRIYQQVGTQIVATKSATKVTGTSVINVRPAPSKPPAAFEETHAVHAILSAEGAQPTQITLALGDSLVVHVPPEVGVEISSVVVTLDATVIAPSVPATTNGFVAVGTGKTTIAGMYASLAKAIGDNTVMGFLEVTVVDKA